MSLPQPVLWMPFEGNANDLSGNGYNGTVVGASLTTGKLGACYSYDGLNDYITLGNVPAKLKFLHTDSFTVCAWVFKTGAGTGGEFGCIAATTDVGNNANSNGFRLATRGGNSAWEFSFANNTADGEILTNPSGWENNIWHHLAGVHTPTELRLHVDAGTPTTMAISMSQAPNYDADNNKFNVGHAGDGTITGSALQGRVDELAIFDVALTQAQIAEVMNGYLRGAARMHHYRMMR